MKKGDLPSSHSLSHAHSEPSLIGIRTEEESGNPRTIRQADADEVRGICPVSPSTLVKYPSGRNKTSTAQTLKPDPKFDWACSLADASVSGSDEILENN